LPALLTELAAANARLALLHGIAPRPLLLKLSPDLSWGELDGALAAAEGAGIGGLIATNTTLSREGLTGSNARESGGLSGRPLAERANAIIAYIHARCGDRLPIIGAGGVQSAADAQRKLDAGAAMVQLYTGFVYEGPGLIGRIVRQLAA
jgi:dihydroorotate dehydrogenase